MIKEGDDHIRLVKSCTKSTFPRMDRKVDFSAEQLNKLYTWLMAVEDAAEDPEALQKFTVLGDMEVRNDLFFTEGGVDGTNTATPETPKISGLSEIQFTTEEGRDPTLIPDEKLSRAVNLRTADKRYAKLKDFEGLDNSQLTVPDGDTRKVVAKATDGVLTVHEKLVAKTIEADTYTVKEELTAQKNLNVSGDLKVTGKIFRGSDQAIKYNIQDIPADITIDSVRPVQYRKGGEDEFGVIAQDLPVEFSHMLSQCKFTKLHSVDYTQFIPVLIKEVQDLKREIRELKGAK